MSVKRTLLLLCSYTTCVQTGYSEQTTELQSQLARIETELSQEKVRYRKVKQELTESQNASFTHEAHAQSLHKQLCDTKVKYYGQDKTIKKT